MSAQTLHLKIGGRYNWRNQSERLVYIGQALYAGDRRVWHQFEKVDKPGKVWSEVLYSELTRFEQSSEPMTPQPPQPGADSTPP